MQSEITTHIVAFVTSMVVGILTYVALQSFAAGGAESVGLAVVSGLSVQLIFDRVSYRKTIEKTKEDLIRSLRVGTPFEAGYRIFKTEKEATAYLSTVLYSATTVWNTRLAKKTTPAARAFFSMVEEHDTAMFDVLNRGGDLRIIYEVSDEYDLGFQTLNDSADRILMKNNMASFELYLVDFKLSPVTQMIILENEEGLSEALIGWTVGKEKSFNYSVCLFRDKALVDFFKKQFDEYTFYRTG